MELKRTLESVDWSLAVGRWPGLDHNRLAKRLGARLWAINIWRRGTRGSCMKSNQCIDHNNFDMLRIQIRAQLAGHGQRGRERSIAPESQSQCEAKEAAAKIYEKPKKKKTRQTEAAKATSDELQTHNVGGVGAANAEAETKSVKKKKQRNEVEEKNVTAESVDQKGARNKKKTKDKKQLKKTQILRQTMIHFN